MWLTLEPDLVIVGESSDGSDVGPLIDKVQPDVVLMDLGMPGPGGMIITAEVHATWPELPVVVLSMHDDTETRARAWLAGAAAFISKYEAEPNLLKTIRGVAQTRRPV
jgi:DNA-binding NarL/FixJ family response regulator